MNPQCRIHAAVDRRQELPTLDNDASSKYRRPRDRWRPLQRPIRPTRSAIEAEGAPVIRTGKTNKRSRSRKELVLFHDYLDDTGVDDFKRMKNDHTCKYMRFAQTKAEVDRREAAIRKYADI